MTRRGRSYPTRINCQFQGKDGSIILDQICTIDKTRLLKKLGKISQDEQTAMLATLVKIFSN